MFLKRWFEILLYIIAAIMIILPFHWLIQQFGRLSLWKVQVYLFLASLVLSYFLIVLGGFRLRHFLHVSLFIKYPPLWFGTLTIFITALLLFEGRNFEDFARLLHGTQQGIFMIFSGFMVVLCCTWHKNSNKSNKKDVENPVAVNIKDLIKDKEKFIQWLNKEAPIETQDSDFFNFELQAKKLLAVLKEPPAKSIGLVGQYGCGKSSLLNLVKSHLREDDNIIVSTIGAWGFREGKAVELVLEHITADISENVDVLSITALPRQYQAMLSGCGNGVAQAISSIFTPRKPIYILDKIDSLLEKTGFRVVVFLEDLDRNLQQDVLFEEVATLLDSLHRLKRITFVLALGNHSHAQQLLIRLCEHIEVITPLNNREVIYLIEQFREMCFCEYSMKDIVSRDKHDKRFGAGKSEILYKMCETNDIYRDLLDYAAILLQTPRILKASLRRSWLSWQRLYGEIDFDEMFSATILRESAPEAFLFVNHYINSLRSLCLNRSDKQEKETQRKVETLNRAWDYYTQNVKWDKDAAKGIIRKLFPGWCEKEEQSASYHFIEEMSQGFLKTEPTDYWQRFCREALVEDEIRDQEVIKAILEWQNNHHANVHKHKPLSETLYRIDGFADKVEQFGILLSQKEIRELASQLFAIALKEKKAEATHQDCPGFTELWRMSNNKSYQENDSWAISEFQKAIRISLRFAKDIHNFWIKELAITHSIPIPEIRHKQVDIFKEEFEREPKKLVSILSLSDPWGLYHFVYLEKNMKPNIWDWLGEVLLSASKDNPRLISSCIACLISNTERIHNSDEDYFKNSLNYERIDELFGENIQDMMEILQAEYKYPEFANDFYYAQTRSVLENAREEARQWIERNKKEHSK